jgi:UDP-N-acetylmuramoylalanine--D-glutamate ligase
MGAVIPRPPLPPGPFVVVGLARSGVAAALALRERGEEVIGTDSRVVDAEVRARLEAAGIKVRDGETGAGLVDGARTVIKSPGVPQESPVVAAARAQGLQILGEVELGWRLLPNEFLALTGSNGKTTTVELIGHIHRVAGLPVTVGGNVGTALVSLEGVLEADALVVCEVSSFQLEDTLAFAPETAMLLNLTEDHLDRHGTFAAYRAAKLEVFAHQPAGTLAVVPALLPLDDAGGAATRVTFGEGPGPDLAHVEGELRWRGVPLMPAAELALRGAHNRENSMAAAAACLARGVDAGAVRAGLATFAGVPHRLEPIATVAGVSYVNDSKATNVASAEVGIRAFAGGVRLIAGGSRKGSDYSPLAAPVAERCAAVYLIGETAPELRAALEPAGVPLHDCGDLERAVGAAHAAARPGEVVLLSPACASYDQYRSYEERGAHFRALVGTLV